MLGSYINIDRAMVESSLDRVDVIIPVKNTKDNWEDCLDSFYREIPINRLLIGDGGCTDNTIEIVRKYPRVTVFDHSKFKTLGYSIKRLIEEVKTDWFIYLHSDVSLPHGWYDEMCKYREKWDWFECRRVAVYHFEEELESQFETYRAYSGSQMGKKKVFSNINGIEDDYVNRSEDLLFQERVEISGYKYGKVPTTFHFHHIRSSKDSVLAPRLIFNVYRERTREWHIRVAEEMIKATVKYMTPNKKTNVETVNGNVRKLIELDAWDGKKWRKWVRQTSPLWEEKMSFKLGIKKRLRSFIGLHLRVLRRFIDELLSIYQYQTTVKEKIT